MQETLANGEPHPDQLDLLERPQPQLWTVELEVEGHAWVGHTWTGHALDSIQATADAKRDFFGSRADDPAAIAATPLRVRSCCMVGV